VADQASNGAQEQTLESRLYSAGFTRRLEFWCPPGDERALSLNDAIAMLDAGEVKPHPAEVLEWPAHAEPGFAELTAERVDELADQLFRPPPPPPPPWLPELAAMVAAKLKPIIRAEVRAAVKAVARKGAREPKA
jgi:hypothetical protein